MLLVPGATRRIFVGGETILGGARGLFGGDGALHFGGSRIFSCRD